MPEKSEAGVSAPAGRCGGEVAGAADAGKNAELEVVRVGDVSIIGNVICPLCGRWTGKNARIDDPPYFCPYCEVFVELLPRQEQYYKERYEDRDGVGE